MENLESKDEAALKTQIALRCAKAAMLVSSLKPLGNRKLKTKDNEDKCVEREMMLKRETVDLKIELVKERVKNRKMRRLCSLTESILQIALLISLWTLCSLIAFKFL